MLSLLLYAYRLVVISGCCRSPARSKINVKLRQTRRENNHQLLFKNYSNLVFLASPFAIPPFFACMYRNKRTYTQSLEDDLATDRALPIAEEYLSTRLKHGSWTQTQNHSGAFTVTNPAKELLK